MNAIKFKCPECNGYMLADAIWMDPNKEFFIQAACGSCQKVFDYPVNLLMANILEVNLAKGPKRLQ